MNDAALPWRPGDPVAAPTADPETAKADIARFGYCILADVLEGAVLEATRERLVAQAEAERRAGVAFADRGRTSRRSATTGRSRPTRSPRRRAASTSGCGCWSTRGASSATW